MPGAAAPLLCCDSRLVHQTAGLSRAAVCPGAVDVGSVGDGVGGNVRLYKGGETQKQQNNGVSLWHSSNLPVDLPPACGQRHW